MILRRIPHACACDAFRIVCLCTRGRKKDYKSPGPHMRHVTRCVTGHLSYQDSICPVSAFYKGESQGKKQPRRLEGAKTFAALSSPSHVERLWGVRSS